MHLRARLNSAFHVHRPFALNSHQHSFDHSLFTLSYLMLYLSYSFSIFSVETISKCVSISTVQTYLPHVYAIVFNFLRVKKNVLQKSSIHEKWQISDHGKMVWFGNVVLSECHFIGSFFVLQIVLSIFGDCYFFFQIYCWRSFALCKISRSLVLFYFTMDFRFP